ncbi:hypothetical protein ACJX0J_030690 [Zea mays]
MKCFSLWFQYKKFAAKVIFTDINIFFLFTSTTSYWFMVIYDLFGNASAWQHVFFGFWITTSIMCYLYGFRFTIFFNPSKWQLYVSYAAVPKFPYSWQKCILNNCSDADPISEGKGFIFFIFLRKGLMLVVFLWFQYKKFAAKVIFTGTD